MGGVRGKSCKNTAKSLNVTASRFGLVILEVQPLAELKIVYSIPIRKKNSCNYYKIDATGIVVNNSDLKILMVYLLTFANWLIVALLVRWSSR